MKLNSLISFRVYLLIGQ